MAQRTKLQEKLAQSGPDELLRLAERVDVDLSTVYRWRSGARKPRNPAVVAALFAHYPDLDHNGIYGAGETP